MANSSEKIQPSADAVALVQKLFIKHSNSIRGYLFAMSADGHLVDDVMHSTFLALTAKADQFDGQREFVPWARGFAKNELLKVAGQRKRDPQLLTPEAIEHLHDAAPEFTLGDERVSALLACLDQLAPRARQAVVLRYRESLKPQMIAERMRLAVASVNVTLSKARAALKGCVELKLRAGE
jgi:RNA polymerase sigma-70 factor (ECF subfamily)